MQRPLMPGNQRTVKHERIVGFDVETCDDNQGFVCATLDFDGHFETFFSRQELYARFLKRDMRGKIIVATNLSFDFCAAFFGSEHAGGFRLLMRGSSMIWAKTYTETGTYKSTGKTPLLFVDTMNYVPFSVKRLGEMVGVSKRESPAALGRRPFSDAERDELVAYNVVDARISRLALVSLVSAFESLGSSFRPTIASTALSIFRNVYLSETIHSEETSLLLDDFKSYYGGRVEALRRGTSKDMYLYDINSLYPAMMRKELPDPSSRRTTYKNDGSYIRKYEGVAHVDIEVPDNGRLPVLPTVVESKLIFGIGKMSGWWTHIELREAMRRGAVITRVHKTHYFPICKPYLADYVDDLYRKRREYQKAGDEVMQLACKLAMNSLYGKFGQKFLGRDNLIHEAAMTKKDIDKYDSFERVGDYFRVVLEEGTPSSCCHPIWASYITAMGRLEISRLAEQYDASYMDTDSILTTEKITSSTALGELKLERVCERVLVVRPKFYAVRGEGFDYAKSKGVGVKLVYSQAQAIIRDGSVSYTKLLRLREALRRDLLPNAQVDIIKHLGLEDTKRAWPAPFTLSDWQESKPLEIVREEGLNVVRTSPLSCP